MAVGRSIIRGGGGGSYLYNRVQTPEKQLISKEINCAKHEYMNMSPPNYPSSYDLELSLSENTGSSVNIDAIIKTLFVNFNYLIIF